MRSIDTAINWLIGNHYKECHDWYMAKTDMPDVVRCVRFVYHMSDDRIRSMIGIAINELNNA